MGGVYDALCRHWPHGCGIDQLVAAAERRLQSHSHGDLPRWRQAISRLPAVTPSASLDRAAPTLGGIAGDGDQLRETLMTLHPWRKGPLRLGGVYIDSEWRSDWKWQRIAPHVDLRGCRVLDIGSGNGYYGLRMLGAGAEVVVGIDPTILFVMQWFACRHFGGDLPNFVLPLAGEELPPDMAGFDVVFSMGVLYHRRDPGGHLYQLRGLVPAGGTLVLETLVLPAGSENGLLRPKGRYARMRNVWSLPGTERLLQWLRRAGFQHAELVEATVTTLQEQRSTPWMRFESLEQALDPGDRTRTVEGLPAPVRAVVIARG